MIYPQSVDVGPMHGFVFGNPFMSKDAAAAIGIGFNIGEIGAKTSSQYSYYQLIYAKDE